MGLGLDSSELGVKFSWSSSLPQYAYLYTQKMKFQHYVNGRLVITMHHLVTGKPNSPISCLKALNHHSLKVGWAINSTLLQHLIKDNCLFLGLPSDKVPPNKYAIPRCRTIIIQELNPSITKIIP